MRLLLAHVAVMVQAAAQVATAVSQHRVVMSVMSLEAVDAILKLQQQQQQLA